MIKSTALSELLKRSLKHGIDMIFISTLSGAILAKEGLESTSTITDVISSIWTDYNAIGEFLNEEKLNYLIIENEDSIVIATHVYGYIVTMKAGVKCNLGMLKVHLDALAKFLMEKFSEFKQILSDRADTKID